VGIPGAKPRAILTMLGLHDGSVVSAAALVELLWGDDPPRTAAKALQTHISAASRFGRRLCRDRRSRVDARRESG
jgi:DNA-binding SARP family transcriptional activator